MTAKKKKHHARSVANAAGRLDRVAAAAYDTDDSVQSPVSQSVGRRMHESDATI